VNKDNRKMVPVVMSPPESIMEELKQNIDEDRKQNEYLEQEREKKKNELNLKIVYLKEDKTIKVSKT
jgi:hypothetical protein